MKLALPDVHRQTGLHLGLGQHTCLCEGGHCMLGCWGWHFARVHKWGTRI